MQYNEEFRAYSIEELNRIAEELKQHEVYRPPSDVLIVEFDGVLSLPSDRQGTDQYLNGGEATIDQLQALYRDGTALCLITYQGREGAARAHDFLKDKGISYYFKFLVYDQAEASSDSMFQACKNFFTPAEQRKNAANMPKTKFVVIKASSISNLAHLGMRVESTFCGHDEQRNAANLSGALQKAKRYFARVPLFIKKESFSLPFSDWIVRSHFSKILNGLIFRVFSLRQYFLPNLLA